MNREGLALKGAARGARGQAAWLDISGRVASARLAESTILPRAPMQTSVLGHRRIEVDGGWCKSLGRDLR